LKEKPEDGTPEGEKYVGKDLEFFKLDPIDRLVLIWLIEHADEDAIKSWINYIRTDYKRRKSIDIDPERLFQEARL